MVLIELPRKVSNRRRIGMKETEHGVGCFVIVQDVGQSGSAAPALEPDVFESAVVQVGVAGEEEDDNDCKRPSELTMAKSRAGVEGDHRQNHR